MGLSEWGDLLQGVGSIFQAIAIGTGAYFAAQSFNGWRKQNVEERRIQQAERILTAMYDVKTALTIIRAPSFSMQEVYEGNRARRQFPEVANVADWTDAYLVESRLSKYTQAFDRLNECRPMALAMFGRKAESAIEDLCEMPNSIMHSASSIRMRNSDKSPIYTMQKMVISSEPKNNGSNPMNKKITMAVSTLEDICLPILRHDGDAKIN